MNRHAWTLPEALVATLVLGIMILLVSQLVSYSQRGTMRGQEAAIHLYVENILSQRLERDFRSILPYQVRTSRGKVGTPMAFAPSADQASEVLFCRLSAGGWQRIRYAYDAARAEVRREEVDDAGQAGRTERFGTGLITGFTMSDASRQGRVFRVQVTMKGKERTTVMDRIFSHGVSHQQFTQHWVFSFP